MNSTTEVAFGLENTGLSHAEIVRKTDEVFRRFGLEKLRGRSVFMLSSGERQLIAILSAMVMDTDTILLDEPTANLDTAFPAADGHQGNRKDPCDQRTQTLFSERSGG